MYALLNFSIRCIFIAHCMKNVQKSARTLHLFRSLSLGFNHTCFCDIQRRDNVKLSVTEVFYLYYFLHNEPSKISLTFSFTKPVPNMQRVFSHACDPWCWKIGTVLCNDCTEHINVRILRRCQPSLCTACRDVWHSVSDARRHVTPLAELSNQRDF